MSHPTSPLKFHEKNPMYRGVSGTNSPHVKRANDQGSKLLQRENISPF